MSLFTQLTLSITLKTDKRGYCLKRKLNHERKLTVYILYRPPQNQESEIIAICCETVTLINTEKDVSDEVR